MNKFITLLLFFSISVFAEKQDEIIFASSSIGSIQLSKDTKVSLYKLKQAFPYYKVTHEIAEGDSPDYHRFIVSTWEDEDLIYFHSYIDEPKQYEAGLVKLDEVVTCSERIKDEFGISPNQHIDLAIEKRKSLDFGAGHMDNYLGKDSIWYLFYVGQLHGTAVTKEVALKENPKIECISWPHPWWR